MFNLSPFSLHALASLKCHGGPKNCRSDTGRPQISRLLLLSVTTQPYFFPTYFFLIIFTKLRQRVASEDDRTAQGLPTGCCPHHPSQHARKARGAVDLFPFPPSFMSPSADSRAEMRGFGSSRMDREFSPDVGSGFHCLIRAMFGCERAPKQQH